MAASELGSVSEEVRCQDGSEETGASDPEWLAWAGVVEVGGAASSLSAWAYLTLRFLRWSEYHWWGSPPGPLAWVLAEAKDGRGVEQDFALEDPEVDEA